MQDLKKTNSGARLAGSLWLASRRREIHRSGVARLDAASGRVITAPACQLQRLSQIGIHLNR
jgi:hypothetical protein